MILRECITNTLGSVSLTLYETLGVYYTLLHIGVCMLHFEMVSGIGVDFSALLSLIPIGLATVHAHCNAQHDNYG